MTTGEKIRNARKAKKLTLEEVGNKLGVARQTIQKYEKGLVTNIPLERFQALAEILGVSPVDLMEIDIEENFVTRDQLKFALFDGYGDITDDMLDEVMRYAKYVEDKYNDK